MRKWKISLAMVLGLLARSAYGQENPALPPATAPRPAPAPAMDLVGPGLIDPAAIGGAPCAPYCGLRYWVSGEYVHWWVRSAPLPPLATTGDPATAAAHGLPVTALGTPGTVILSPNEHNYGGLSGGRLTFGGWGNADETWGLEASGFLTQTRSVSFAVRSDANGSPVLGVPAIATPPVTPTFTELAQIMSFPGGQAGGIAFTSAIRLWGAEANGLLGVWNTGQVRLNLLAGFRYIDLAERFDMSDSTTIIGVPAPPTFLFHDHFGTHNQIYAGQIGARGEVTFGRFFANLTGKLALGSNHETIDVNGNTIIPTMPFPFAAPVAPINAGGIFAQPTNSGVRYRNEFEVVPEIRLQIGFDLTDHIRVFAGYEYLFMDRVVRPGDQIDRVVNGSQGFGGVLSGAATGVPRPAPMFNQSNFSAHGFSVGMRIDF
jgi:hypothetical protein